MFRQLPARAFLILRASRTAGVRLPRRSFSGATRKHALEQAAAPAGLPQPGAQLHGFTLHRVQHVPELQLTAFELKHNKTGAEYLHVDRDDSNNVFSIGFKTNPPDDTGVPHILEHTTLCGSKRFVRSLPFALYTANSF